MGQSRRRGERATGPGTRRKRTPLRQAGNSEKPEEEERNLEVRARSLPSGMERTWAREEDSFSKNHTNMDLRLVSVKVRPEVGEGKERGRPGGICIYGAQRKSFPSPEASLRGSVAGKELSHTQPPA